MNNSGPYDLNKLNPDKLRLQKRKKLFKRSVLITILGTIIALKLMSPTLLTSASISAYNSKDFKAAKSRISLLKIINIIEPYKYYLNSGDAKYQLGDFPGAERDFREAQKLVPKDKFCQITLNLILSIEAQADSLAAKKDYDKAIERYDEIKALVIDSRCGNSEEEKKADSKSKEVEQRSSDKSDAAKKARNGDDSKKTNSEQDQDQKADKLTKDQTDKLQSAEAKSLKKRQQSQQRKDTNDFDLSKRKYDAKNW
jgi:Ca-activated chloride channel homolog